MIGNYSQWAEGLELLNKMTRVYTLLGVNIIFYMFVGSHQNYFTIL